VHRVYGASGGIPMRGVSRREPVLFCLHRFLPSSTPLTQASGVYPASHELHCIHRILTTGLGKRLFQARDARESWPRREPRALGEVLPFPYRAPEDPCRRPFGPSHCLRSFLQVFRKRIPRKLSPTPPHRLVPSVGASSTNGLHI